MFMAKGFKAVFKASVALLIHFREKLIKMNFEQVLQFLNELIQTEVFMSTHYDKFLDFKKKGLKLFEIRKEMKEADDYEFVYSFKNFCRGLTISEGLLARLETRYKFISEKMGK